MDDVYNFTKDCTRMHAADLAEELAAILTQISGKPWGWTGTKDEPRFANLTYEGKPPLSLDMSLSLGRYEVTMTRIADSAGRWHWHHEVAQSLGLARPCVGGNLSKSAFEIARDIHRRMLRSDNLKVNQKLLENVAEADEYASAGRAVIDKLAPILGPHRGHNDPRTGETSFGIYWSSNGETIHGQIRTHGKSATFERLTLPAEDAIAVVELLRQRAGLPVIAGPSEDGATE